MDDDPDALTGDEVIPPKLPANLGFISDSQPYEPPLDAATLDYRTTPPPFGQRFGAEIEQSSPLAWLGRAVERGTQQGASGFDRGLVSAGHAAQSALDVEAGIVPNAAGEPVQSEMLTADEANKRYAPEGSKITDQPIPDGLARIIGRQKTEELRRNSILSRSAEANSWPVNFGTGMAAFMLDPVNLATNFVPGIGEATIGAAVGRIGLSGLPARMLTRAAAGATAMTAQQGPLAIAELALGREEASDFGFRDALTQVFYGAALGAAFHAGFGGLREAGLLRPDHLMHPPEPPELPTVTVTHAPPLPESTLIGPHADALAAEVEPRGPIDLAEHGFTPADIAALHADGLADGDGTMSPEQVAAWREEREVRKPAEEAPAGWVWRSADHDFPVTPTGEEVTHTDGRIYAKVRQADGAESYVPKDELVRSGAAEAPHAPDAASVSLPAHAHADAMKAAVAEVLDERPVDVTPVIEQTQAAKAAVQVSGGNIPGQLPIERFRRDAAAIEATLPPVQPGQTRLWRGNRPGEVGTARQFTNDLAGIALPFREPYGGDVSYLDVATADLGKYAATSGAAPGAEFLVPHDLAAAAHVVKVTPRAPPQTPADVAAKQQDLVRNGHVTGIPDGELKATTEAIYKPPEEPEKPAEAAKPKAEEKPRVIPKAAEAPKPPALAPEQDREHTTAPKPVFQDVAMEPAQLQRSITFNHERAAASDRAAKNARTATARAALRDEATNYRAYGRARQAVLDRWKAEHPDEAARIFGDADTAAPEPAPKAAGMALVETTHSKGGYPLFVVTLADRLPRPRYKALEASAAEGGGKYSTWKGPGGVPGFQFRTREAAETFLRKERGEPVEAAPTTEALLPPPHERVPEKIGDHYYFKRLDGKYAGPFETIGDLRRAKMATAAERAPQAAPEAPAATETPFSDLRKERGEPVEMTVPAGPVRPSRTGADRPSYWMNEGEVDEAIDRHRSDPLLGPVTRWLGAYRDVVNEKSDGWAHWGSSVAKPLMGLIHQGEPRNRNYWDKHGGTIAPTEAEIRAAISPIKAFATKHGLNVPDSPLASAPAAPRTRTREAAPEPPQAAPEASAERPRDMTTLNLPQTIAAVREMIARGEEPTAEDIAHRTGTSIGYVEQLVLPEARKPPVDEGARIAQMVEEQRARASTRPATYGANNKLVTTADADAIRARMRARASQLRTGIDPELMLDGARLAVYHIEAGTRAFADYAREMAADIGHEFRPYLRSWYEAARHWPGVDSTGLSTPAEIDAALAHLGPHETPGELSHEEADRLLDAYGRPEMDRIAQDIADGHTHEEIAETSGLTVAEVRGLADALDRRGEIPEPTDDAEPIDYSERQMQDWWDKLPPDDRKLAGTGTTGRHLVEDETLTKEWDDLSTPEQDALRGVRERWDAEDAATARSQQTLPLETQDGVQGPVPVRDEGAGAADVQPTPALGADGRPSAGEVGGGPRTPETTPGTAAEEPIRQPQPGGRTRGGGAGPRDTDRLPETGGPRPGGAAGRPAPDALVTGQNHVIEPGTLAESRGRIAKARGNLEAIELAKQLIAEDRVATKAEQAILARYVGWGGLKGAFDVDGQFGKGLETIGARLKELLTEDEHRTAVRSVQYAHYTSETIVRTMWDTVRGMGFKDGNVFEPGMGIGHFIGLMPPDIAAKARYQGIEMDKLTASIAKLLYPKSGVRNADFIRTAMPADHFDLAIGNPPFSDVVVQADPKYSARGFMLHDYFFAKSLDSVRPGGILSFVTSAGTMNKLDTAAREYLAERAEFVGGVRLPNNAFAEGAGTKVTTDILFFRRLEPGETAERNPGWTETVQRTLPDKDGNPVEANVSRYFSEHPEQVLGREGMTDKTVAGVRYAVDPEPGMDFPTALREAMDRLPKDVMTEPATPEARAALDFASGQKKDGSFYLRDDGALMQYRDGAGREVPRRGKGETGGFTAAEVERIQHLIPMRDALRDVFAADLAKDDAAGVAGRAALNEHYDRFVEKFGPINKAEFQYRRPTLAQQETARLEAREEARSIGERFNDGDFDPAPYLTGKAKITEIARARQQVREQYAAAGRTFNEGEFEPSDMPDVVFERRPNIRPFMGDPESYRLRSIEKYNDATGEAEKRDIFRRNILADKLEPEIRSANDGVLWSLNQHGRLDLDAIAAKMGRERGAIVGELGDSIYKVPGTLDTYQTKDEYLSGDVVTKLEQARAAAEHDPDVRRNVQALEAAVPAPLAPSEISMVLGMPWIPEEIYRDFAETHLELGPSRITHNPGIGSWLVDAGDNPAWGTPDRNAGDLLSDAMNRTPPRIYEPPDRDGRRAFDPVATQAAQDKVDAMKAAFNDWAAADPERMDALATLYNDKLNRSVMRMWDGSYLTTPGVAADWSWRAHQLRVVARIVQDGNTYMAHAVGAGKTSAMIGAGMEMRRLGLARKPIYIVPNHMLGQFTKEFYEQYPTARIAVADEERFHTSRRKQFIANVSQDDLDAIIITHSGFAKIPVSDEFQGHLIQEQLDMLQEALSGLDEQGDRHTVRRIENMKEKLEQKLSDQGAGGQDQTMTFEQMGVDFAFVDEAHLFRKLAFGTKQGNLKGISPEGSGMAWDLYSKMRYLDDQKPGRSHVFASGTPITNTMGELYSLSRFMQPEALKERGISHFDSWAQTFGDTKTQLEENAAGGYQPVTRFNQFVNMPELYKMVGEIMDIVTPSQLEQYVTRPQLAGGARQLHMAPRTDILDAYQADLAARMEAIKRRRGPPSKGDDILLSVINDGRHAAIDPRFVAETGNDPHSKLNIMLANVARIWRETADHEFFDPADGYKTSLGRGPASQMIFANLGVNGRGPMGFSTYQWIKEALRREGIPPEQIAFIGDYSGSVQRQALFNDVNAGKVRILVGSTQKMGTGVNAQKRLVAIHNLDPLWFPADDEQRVGRGLRQGNTNKELQVHDYTTKGTYDSAMWGMMGKKARFIEQFFRGDPELRTMEDLGEASMYEQASAMSTTDERMITLTDLRQELDKAQRRESGYEREQYAARTKVKNEEWTAAYHKNQATALRQDVAQRIDTRGDAFAMTVAGEQFSKRKDAAEALAKALEERKPTMGKKATSVIGNIGGFPLIMERDNSQAGNFSYDLRMNGGRTISVGGIDAAGMIASAETKLRDLEDTIEFHDRRSGAATDEAERSRARISTAPNPHAPDVARLRQSVADLEAEMRPQTEAERHAEADAIIRKMAGVEPEDDPEMAEADRQLAEIAPKLSTEEHAEIAATTDAVAKAEQTAAALTEAAACLRGTE